MTVCYVQHLATSRKGALLKILLRWKASIYKEIWCDLVLFLFIYYALKFTYVFALEEHQKRIFEFIVVYFEEKSNLFPLTFILGFYISVVMERWWEQYLLIPWPDDLALSVATLIEGRNKYCRLIRRTIMRYAMLTFIIAFREISTGIRRKFPDLQAIVDFGMLTEKEKAIIEEGIERTQNTPIFLPIMWANKLVLKSFQQRCIKSHFYTIALMKQLNNFRACCGGTLIYFTSYIPLIYSQVLTIAVYSFFLTCLMGRQFTTSSKNQVLEFHHVYFPFFTVLSFCFYVGCLKIAACLINPYGDDDDDFEICYLFDRNLRLIKIASICGYLDNEQGDIVNLYINLDYSNHASMIRSDYRICNNLYDSCPSLTKDKYHNKTDSLQEKG